MADRYQDTFPDDNQRGLLLRNLLTKSLDYKLKKHRRQLLKQQEIQARDISTATSAQLSMESVGESLDRSNEIEDNYITSKHMPGTIVSKPSVDHRRGLEIIKPPTGKNNDDQDIRQENDPVQSSRYTKYDSIVGEDQYFENGVLGEIQKTVKVRKRNGVFEPVSKNFVRKQTESYPLCKRQPSGRRYKTFILSGDAIREIKPVHDKGVGKGKPQPWNPNMGQEKSELRGGKNCDVDETYAFRRPEYLPPRRDIDSVGVTWSFPAIEQETTKERKKPVWSWLVVQDNYQGTGKPMADHSVNRQAALSSQGLDLRGRHSRDIHPVATAMNRDGLSASKVKWCVPESRAVDAGRLVMERLELIKKPGSCLLCDH